MGDWRKSWRWQKYGATKLESFWVPGNEEDNISFSGETSIGAEEPWPLLSFWQDFMRSIQPGIAFDLQSLALFLYCKINNDFEK